MESLIILLIAFLALVLSPNRRILGVQGKRKKRRDYYRNNYLKSEEWQRKRYVVLKRDNWTCVSCGMPATEVHHKRYARINIGKEPIGWLESLCKECHMKKHTTFNSRGVDFFI